MEFKSPVYNVIAVPIEKVVPNTYNPNTVAPPEMKLLYDSIKEDGYTMPIVCYYAKAQDRYIIVDGFHRYRVMLEYPDIYQRENGMLPVSVIDKPLAQRMAKKALKTGRPVALEPMNPYERRIIHAVVTDIDGVFSKSTGEEPNRKVVIKPSSRRNSGSKGRPGRSSRPNHKPAPAAEGQAPETAPVPAPAKEEKVVLDDNVKLYSKIEL